MNHTKIARRLSALLAVPTLLLTAAACGSNAGGGSSGATAQVSGKFGDKPAITIPKDAKPGGKTVVKTMIAGSGTQAKQGDFVRLDFEAESWKDSKDLGGTWTGSPGQSPRRQDVERIGQQSQQLPAKVLDVVAGQKAGSRILIQGTAGDLVGQGLNPQSGLSAGDTLVWVVDLYGAASVDSNASVKGTQAAPDPGMPEVKAEPGKAAVITIPKGAKPPTDLKQQVLIKGNGPAVQAGQALIAQYTGVTWQDGKKFDSSWDHGGATAFQIGTGSVVKGWDQGLVGKHVGDRVLLVVPGPLGYGAQGNPQGGIPPNATLVFVVDILGTA